MVSFTCPSAIHRPTLSGNARNRNQIIHKLLHFRRIPSEPFLLDMDMLTLLKYMYKINCYLPMAFDRNSNDIRTNSRGGKQANHRKIAEQKNWKQARHFTRLNFVLLCANAMCWTNNANFWSHNEEKCVWTQCSWACSWEKIRHHNYDRRSVFLWAVNPPATTAYSNPYCILFSCSINNMREKKWKQTVYLSHIIWYRFYVYGPKTLWAFFPLNFCHELQPKHFFVRTLHISVGWKTRIKP